MNFVLSVNFHFRGINFSVRWGFIIDLNVFLWNMWTPFKIIWKLHIISDICISHSINREVQHVIKLKYNWNKITVISREHRRQCFISYVGAVLFVKVLKTLKQLWNAQTVCCTVLFEFYFTNASVWNKLLGGPAKVKPTYIFDGNIWMYS